MPPTSENGIVSRTISTSAMLRKLRNNSSRMVTRVSGTINDRRSLARSRYSYCPDQVSVFGKMHVLLESAAVPILETARELAGADVVPGGTAFNKTEIEAQATQLVSNLRHAPRGGRS